VAAPFPMFWMRAMLESETVHWKSTSLTATGPELVFRNACPWAVIWAPWTTRGADMVTVTKTWSLSSVGKEQVTPAQIAAKAAMAAGRETRGKRRMAGPILE